MSQITQSYSFNQPNNPKLHALIQAKNKVQKQVQKQIQSGIIKVGNHQVIQQHLIPKNKCQQSVDHKQTQLNKIQSKKQSILNQLKTLEEEEKSIKYSRRIRRRLKVQKSHHSPEDRQAILKIIKEKHQYNLSLKVKTQEKQKERQLSLLKQMKDHQEKVQKNKQLRRKIAQQNLNNQKLKKEERSRVLQKNNPKDQILPQKYSFIKYSQKDKQLQSMFILQRQKKLKEIRQYFKLNIQEIKIHQQQYLQQKKKIQFLKKYNKRNSTITHSNSSPYQQNKFQRLARIQRQQQQQLKRSKKDEIVQRLDKLQQFKRYLNEKFRSKLNRVNHSVKSQAINQKSRRHKLSYNQLRELGNQYLKIARRMRKDDEQLFLDLPKNLNQSKRYQKNIDIIKSTYKKIVEKNKNKIKHITTDPSQYQSQNQQKNQKLLLSVKNKLQLLKMLT